MPHELAAAIDERTIPDSVRGRPATITATPGGGLVTIKFGGDAVGKNVPYLLSYATPTIGDVVIVLQFGTNQYIVIGEPA